MRGVPKLILSEADPIQDATQWHPKAYPSRLRHPTSTQRTSSSSERRIILLMLGFKFHHHSGCNITHIVVSFFAFRFIISIQPVAFMLKTTARK